MEKISPRRVCFFGHYDRFYVRNRIIRKALEKNGTDIIEVQSTKKGFRRYVDLLYKVHRTEFDILMVLFPGHTDVPLAWLIAKLKKKPLVFDIFTSLYDSNVFDRSLIDSTSMAARLLFYTDKIACLLSDIIIVDTQEHANYFQQTFGVPKSKLKIMPVGSDDEYMYPRNGEEEDNIFRVFFYGSYIPLHGIDYILDAASIIQHHNDRIFFTLVGSGQTFHAIQEKAQRLSLKNTEFIGRVSYDELPELIARSNLCLGIFGTSEKAARVIPNKVYDALAMGKPIITRDSPAIREWFEHGKHVWLVPPGDGRALAGAILFLSSNKNICAALSENGHALFQKKFSVQALSKEVESILLHCTA